MTPSPATTSSSTTNTANTSKPTMHPTLTQAGIIDFEKEYEHKEDQKNVII
jgi:hypothetical protein